MIRNYAVFLKLKHLHVNSRVYDYSPYKLSKQSGLSRNSIRKYMEFFLDNGWVKNEGNDIIFISTDKLKKLYDIKLRHDLKIKKELSITALVNTLRYEILKHKQKQFNYIKSTVNNLINPTGRNALTKHKRAKKMLPDYKGEVLQNLKISVRKLSFLINKSSSTVSRLIKSKGATVIRGKTTLSKFKNVNLPNGFYWNSGFVVKVECNSYCF